MGGYNQCCINNFLNYKFATCFSNFEMRQFQMQKKVSRGDGHNNWY